PPRPLSLLPSPPLSPLFPYTTLFRSGPFPPPELPGLNGTADLSASPGRPACPSRVSGGSSLTALWGLPCCVRFPCVHAVATTPRSEEHTSELQSLTNLVCRLLLEKKT